MGRGGATASPPRPSGDYAGDYRPVKTGARWVTEGTIGKGAYGVVCAARDAITGERVAIKKIDNALAVSLEAKRLLREIRLLRNLKHPNLIELKEILRPSDAANFRDLYLVYELMETDLYQIVRSQQPLSDAHTRYFMWQLMCGLRYLHAAGVMHRDLNPANLLLNASCELKIADFGLARAAARPGDQPLSGYVVTRWYRAPELLLSAPSYGTGVDTWAAGCVFAELLGRRALFPGRDAPHQLSLVLGVVGSPAERALRRVASPAAAAYTRRLPPAARVSFRHLYPHAPAEACALLDALLVFDPAERGSAADALAHPYLAAYADDDADDGALAAAAPPLPPPGALDFGFEALAELDESRARALVLIEVEHLSGGSWPPPQQQEASPNPWFLAQPGASAAQRAGLAAQLQPGSPRQEYAPPPRPMSDDASSCISSEEAMAMSESSSEPPFPVPPKQRLGGAAEDALRGVVLQPRPGSRLLRDSPSGDDRDAPMLLGCACPYPYGWSASPAA